MKKKMTNDEKIIAALDALDRSKMNLMKFGDRYDGYIDKAALRGDDKRARILIKQKLSIYNIANQLETLKANIELGAYTAAAVADLGKLPDAIAGCKGLLAESPNFAKVGKDITKIFKDMQVPVDELEKLNDTLNDVLSPEPEKSLTSRLDNVDPVEESDDFKAEYAAMIERVKGHVTPEMVSKPKSEDTLDTGEIDFAALVEEENKKK